MKQVIKNLVIGLPAAVGVTALPTPADAEKIAWAEADLSQPHSASATTAPAGQAAVWPPLPPPVPVQFEGAIRGRRN